jgi:hypothetical protein
LVALGGSPLQVNFENLTPAVGSVGGVHVVGTERGSILRIFGEEGGAERLICTATKAATAFGLFAFGLAHVKIWLVGLGMKGGAFYECEAVGQELFCAICETTTEAAAKPNAPETKTAVP